MARNRKLKCHRAVSDHLIDSIRHLRNQSEFYRAEVYWSVQRALKNRRHSAAIQNFWLRRRALRLHDDQPRDEIFPYNLPPDTA